MTTSKKKAKQRKSKNNVKLGHSNLVIGLTGPFGSGCSKMREVLAQEEFGFRPFKISEDIRGELGSKNKLIEKSKPGWRRVLQKHGDNRRKEDRAYWVKKVVDRIDKAGIKNENIVIDGFRNFLEVQEIRKFYPRFSLLQFVLKRKSDGSVYERITEIIISLKMMTGVTRTRILTGAKAFRNVWTTQIMSIIIMSILW